MVCFCFLSFSSSLSFSLSLYPSPLPPTLAQPSLNSRSLSRTRCQLVNWSALRTYTRASLHLLLAPYVSTIVSLCVNESVCCVCVCVVSCAGWSWNIFRFFFGVLYSVCVCRMRYSWVFIFLSMGIFYFVRTMSFCCWYAIVFVIIGANIESRSNTKR